MIIPLHKRPDWRDPPLVTLLLMLVLAAVYVLAQSQDRYYEKEAYVFYFRSDLPALELPRYLDYLQHTGHEKAAARLRQLWQRDATRGRVATFHALQADGDFQRALASDSIIRPGSADYARWREQRRRFEALLERVAAYRFGLIPARFSFSDLWTYFFLHADGWHLLFNLLFLFTFGFILEMTWGRAATLATFVGAGVLSGLFFVLLEPGSARWGVGASGAIAGLAGAYLALFGLRKVRFFYFLLVYFDSVTAPAILVLPVWLAYEAADYFLGMSQMNNLAHVGGLLTGAAAGLLALRVPGLVVVRHLETEPPDQALREGLDAVRRHVVRLELDQARALLGALAQRWPGHPEVLAQRFNLAKLQPQSEEFRRAAQAVLELEQDDDNTVNLMHRVFQDLQRYAPKALPADEQAVRLMRRFLACGWLESAEAILDHLLDRTPAPAGLPEAVAALVKAFARAGNAARARELVELLQARFPDSEAARQLRHVRF